MRKKRKGEADELENTITVKDEKRSGRTQLFEVETIILDMKLTLRST